MRVFGVKVPSPSLHCFMAISVFSTCIVFLGLFAKIHRTESPRILFEESPISIKPLLKEAMKNSKDAIPDQNPSLDDKGGETKDSNQKPPPNDPPKQPDVKKLEEKTDISKTNTSHNDKDAEKQQAPISLDTSNKELDYLNSTTLNVTYEKSLSYYNETKLKIINQGENIQVEDRQVHITTAAHYDKYPSKYAYSVFLNGWARYKVNMNFTCCFLREYPEGPAKDSYIAVKGTVHHIYTQWIVDMQNAEFSCSLTHEEKAAIGDTNFKYVTFAKKQCKFAPPLVMEILHPQRVPNSVGLCLKVTYGKLNPEKMVEWFEYTRMLNVTKVFTYYFDVEPEVYKVLEYYKSIGYLDLLLIHPAKSDIGKDRGFRHPRYSEQAWVDEVMGANDCKHRMAGFDYVIVMDIDEYIIPRGKLKTYHDVLWETEQLHPGGSCFPFDAHVVMPEWGFNDSAPLHLTKETNRSAEPNYDGWERNVRWGFRPNTTYWVRNNGCYPDKGSKWAKIPEQFYYLFHYRRCKKSWKGCTDKKHSHDISMTRYEKALVSRVLKLPHETVLYKNLNYIKYMREWRDKTKRKPEPETIKPAESPETKEAVEKRETKKPAESPETKKDAKSPETKKLAETPETMKDVKSPETKKSAESPETKKAPQNPETKKPAQSPEAKKPAESPETKKALQSPVTKKPAQSPEAKKAAESPEIKKAPQNPETKKPAQSPDTKKTAENPKKVAESASSKNDTKKA